MTQIMQDIFNDSYPENKIMLQKVAFNHIYTIEMQTMTKHGRELCLVILD